MSSVSRMMITSQMMWNYIVLHIQDMAVYISLNNDGRQLWNYDLRSRQDVVLA